jgi:hypothetical protein
MMKLKLDVEALRVESFTAEPGSTDRRGTVQAASWVSDVNNACSEPATPYCMDTDHHLYSCGVSCIDMCHLSGGDPTCYE